MPHTVLSPDSYTSSVLVFSVVTLSTYLIMRILQGRRGAGLPLPPGLPSLPVLGSSLFLSDVKVLPEFFRKTSERLGPVFSCNIGTDLVVVLNSREVIYEALVRKAGAFSGRLSGYTNIHYLNPNGHGIISKQYGTLFRKMHKLSLGILKEFGFGSRILQERILSEVDELIDLMREHKGAAVDPNNLFSICTLNVIASMVFGERLSQRNTILDKLFDTLRFFAQDPRRYVDMFPALRHLPQYKRVIEESIENQRAQIEIIERFTSASLHSERDSFVKRFVELEGGDSYDKNELLFIVRDLLIAGSETTAVTTQFAMVAMANHPEVQSRIHDEMDRVVERGQHVTLDHIQHLPCVEAFILEIMRLHPAAPLALPHSSLEDAELSGYFIPKDSKVLVNIHAAHMDEGVFQESAQFRPERFLDAEGHVTGRDLIIPFSLGKRSCLGELLARQESVLLISNLIHQFKILPPEGEDKVDITEHFLITLYPSPFKLRFVQRL